MYLLALLFAASIYGFAPPSGPVVAPLDQATDVILVGGVHPGARVDVYANAVWIGGAIARGPIVRVRPVTALQPGAAVMAVERMGAVSIHGLRPMIVQHDYTTYHDDDLRTGWNRWEKNLTQSAVETRFGQIFSTIVDGNVEAQPLVVSNVSIPGEGTHDVVYAVTENDSLYALDAAGGQVLWKQNYADGSAGFAPVQATDVGCPFIQPVIGITGTPVIDRTTGTMYFDAFERQTTGNTTTFHHFLHAVDIATGLDESGSPVEIRASLMAPGEGMVTFDAQAQLQRPGLLLVNGVVYLGFGSFCDLMQRQTHGWVLGYSAATLQQVAVFNASLTTKRGLSSVWAGGFGIASAGDDLYFATGNGSFDGSSGGTLWGDSVLRLSPSLSVLDSFTPYNQAMFDSLDLDLGSGGAMVVPQIGGQHPDLLVLEGKYPTLYLIDRQHMGGYNPGGPDRVVQELQNAVGPNHGMKGGPSYYISSAGQPVVFFGGGDDQLKAFAVMSSPTQLVLIDHTAMTFHGEGGASLAVSSDGQLPGTAVLWAVERPRKDDESVRLFAFAADDMAQRLVDLPAGPWFNPQGAFYAVPTVIRGRVYVGSGDAVTGFGLR